MTRMPVQAFFIIILIQILWGGNPVAVKFGLEAFPPLWSGFLRFAAAILCLLIWAWIRNISMWPRRDEWKPLAILGTVFFIQIWTMNYGFDLSTGAISSILISTHPLFAALFAHLLVKGDRLTGIKIAGMAVAFAGTTLIILRGGGLSSDDFSLFGASVIMFSAIILGWRLIFASQMARRLETTKVVCWQMLLPLWAFGLGGFLFEDITWQNDVWGSVSWQAIAGILYQGVIIAGLGFMINTWMLSTYSPSVVVSFGFIAPLSGVAFSIWLLGEPFTWVIAIGVVCVGAGLLLIARKPKEKPEDVSP
jgi:drug/metabolite transporter (DMT)-like permease